MKMNPVKLLVASACMATFQIPANAARQMLLNPNSGKGSMVMANAQKKLPQGDLQIVCKEINEALQRHLSLVIVTDDLDPKKMRTKFKADLALAVIDRPGEPTTLIAIEDHWATVNIAAIPQDDKFRETAKRLVLRTFAILSGAFISQFPKTLLSAKDLTELSNAEMYVTADVTQRQAAYLDSIGVTAIEYSSYHDACQEGWAPAPTNKYQKAIWDEVHQLPTKPIRILPETKPVKK